MSKKIIAKSGGQLQPERPGHFHPEKGGQFHPEKAGVLIRNIQLLFIVIVKYRKYSIPVLSIFSTPLILFLTNTKSVIKPNYFNKLSSGCVDIYIPKSKYS